MLIHPNTNDAHKDHTELQSWMGRPWPLNDGLLKRAVAAHAGAPAA